MVAEDTVSRAQLVLFCSGNDYAMGSEGMGLPAGDTAVLVPMILLAVLSICGMAVVVVMKKRAA